MDKPRGSRNNFVEKAVEFYIGHLNAEDGSRYIGEEVSGFGTVQNKDFMIG